MPGLLCSYTVYTMDAGRKCSNRQYKLITRYCYKETPAAVTLTYFTGKNSSIQPCLSVL